MIRSAWLKGVFVLGSAVAMSACGGGSYHTRTAVVVVPTRVAEVDGDHTPAEFSARVHERMDRITERAYERVHDGRVAPSVIDDLQNRRAVLEARVSEYVADGVVGHHERRNVNDMLEAMEHTIERYEVHGGGPRPVGP